MSRTSYPKTNANLMANEKATPLNVFRNEVQESTMYYNMIPYPAYGFTQQNWDSQRQGPFPTPISMPKQIIDELANFTFSSGLPEIMVKNSETATAVFDAVLEESQIEPKLNALAQMLGIQGNLAVMFSYDGSEGDFPIKLGFLSCPETVVFENDPLNNDKIKSATIQFKIPDPSDPSQLMWHVEKWLADTHIVYEDQPINTNSNSILIGAANIEVPDYDQLEIKEKSLNPYGVIPFVLIKNKYVQGSPFGRGDNFGLFRQFDAVARTLFGEYAASQQTGPTKIAVVDADLVNQEALQGFGGFLTAKSQSEDGHQASISLLEATGAAREFAYSYMDKMTKNIYDAAGCSYVDPDKMTGAGNLTKLAMVRAYAKTIATCNQKRALWTSSLTELINKICKALYNLGIPQGMQIYNEVGGGKLDIEITWQDYFEDTTEDKLAQEQVKENVTTRTVAQVTTGLMPPEHGAARIGEAEGMSSAEITDMINKLKSDARSPVQAVMDSPEDSGLTTYTDMIEGMSMSNMTT